MVEEKKEKEELLNPEEEETSETSEEETEEKPQEEEQEISDKPDETSKELEGKNKRLYARMKKAEEEAKTARDDLAKKKETPSETSSDIFGLAKTVSALRDYAPVELDFIQMMSKAKSISPEEAAKTEEAKLYISARRQKVEAEKTIPEPSTKTSPSEKSIDKITPEDVNKMSLKEKEEYFIKTGSMKKPRTYGKG